MKKGISLIVLVITIIVLAILAAAVIVSVSPNNNVMDKGTAATEAANLASARAIISMYAANNMEEVAGTWTVVKEGTTTAMTETDYAALLGAQGLVSGDYNITMGANGFVTAVATK